MTLDEVLIDVIMRHKQVDECKAFKLLKKSVYKSDTSLNECIMAELEEIEKDKMLAKKVLKEANKALKKDGFNFKIK